MTKSGLPLGLLDQKIFQHEIGEKVNHKQRPITEKQSFRWIEALKTTKTLCPEKTVIINPEMSSAQILEEHEWKALCCYIAKSRIPPNTASSMKETVRMIVKLGGFLGRKHDGEPGMTYIWRGWEKLSTIFDFWSSTYQEATYG